MTNLFSQGGSRMAPPPSQRVWHYNHFPLLLTDTVPHQLFSNTMLVPYLYVEADLINAAPIAIGIGNVNYLNTGSGFIGDCIAQLGPGDWIKWEQSSTAPEDGTGLLEAPSGEDLLFLQLNYPHDLVDASQFWVITGYNVALQTFPMDPVRNLLHITVGNWDRS